jgi:hypothetical protein
MRMKRVFADRFKAQYMNEEKIVCSGELIDINWSNIETKLIQISGRFCDRYASDIIYSINTISEKIKTGEFKDGEFYLFGFRESGVDSKSFIESQNEENLNSEYRQIWRLDVLTDIYGCHSMEFELYRAEYNSPNEVQYLQLMKEYSDEQARLNKDTK